MPPRQHQQQQSHHNQKQPGTKRLLVISSTVAYVLFFGIPVWWHTTSLHRPPLPHEAMQHVAATAASAATTTPTPTSTTGSSSSTAFLPVSLQVVAVLPAGAGHSTQQLAAALHGSLTAAVAASKPGGEPAVQLSVTVAGDGGGGCSHYPAGDAAGAAACRTDWSAAVAPLLSADSSSMQSSQQQFDDWLSTHAAAAAGGAADDVAAGHYRLYLLPAGQQHTGSIATLVVGRHRHAWLLYDPPPAAAAAHSQEEQQLLALLQQQASAAAVQALSCCFALHAGPAGLAAAGSLPISPAGQTHLSLSLLNSDPAAGPHYSWDMEEWEARYLTPLTASLAPVTSVSMESQVLQYTAAWLQGAWSDKHGANVVKGSQLPFFIDSEWSLESGRAVTPNDEPGAAANCTSSSSSVCAAAARQSQSEAGAAAAVATSATETALVEPHVLQFVVYIPPRSHRPLQLLGRKSRIRDSNSYVIPSWGGLMVLNPEEGESDSSSGGSGSATPTPAAAARGQQQLLTAEQHQHIAAVIIAQLQALFGVVATADADPSTGTSSGDSSDADADAAGGSTIRVQRLPAGRLGFSSWQVDALMRQRSAHDVREASRVLGALSTLVEELPNLEMPDLIGEQVAQSLSDISTAWQQTAAGNYTAAAAAATAAHAAAEAAFSHPAVLAQFNFPESHKLGVYMPLFLPLCVPLIQGLMGQLQHYKQRRRACQLT